MLTNDERAVLSKLESWNSQAQKVMAAYPDRGDAWGDAAIVIQSRYKALKDGLRDEHGLLSSERGRRRCSAADRQWYVHVVHEAFCHLRVPVNGRADHKMHSCVYDAHTDFEYVLSQLRAKAAESDK